MHLGAELHLYFQWDQIMKIADVGTTHGLEAAASGSTVVHLDNTCFSTYVLIKVLQNKQKGSRKTKRAYLCDFHNRLIMVKTCPTVLPWGLFVMCYDTTPGLIIYYVYLRLYLIKCVSTLLLSALSPCLHFMSYMMSANTALCFLRGGGNKCLLSL